MKKHIVPILTILLLSALPSAAANLANPAAQVGDARMSFGISYYLGGANITGLELPMMMNRAGGRVSYSPIRYVNFGLDFGTVQASVDKYYSEAARDTIPVFDGGFGGFIGGHLKLTSPYIADYVALMALGSADYFRSTNPEGAYYGGVNITAAAGVQIRIPSAGFLSLGPQIYMIDGTNKGVNRATGKLTPAGSYSPVNNMRAWIAFDYFPEDAFIAWNHKPYVSVEFTASPKISGSKRAPIQEFSLSVSVGAITHRLYGEDTGISH
ncbi:MAG: hypothetical protein FWB85_02815 [Chitinispirillia bacterium]|nr:hypothetical protein [Chitinispirillia bacterium]MCL2241298.1 hypothetical protein [Chitinispirillia bacterium]